MSHKALIIVDVQNDFCSNGALAVPEAEQIIPLINELSVNFSNVILTQDYHPANHTSFASNHKDKKPFDIIQLSYGEQILWPDHCIIGSSGSDFHPDLNITTAQAIIRKGVNPMVDSYSAFFENDKETQTGLFGYLKNKNITDITICGLATDFCVQYSALDAVTLGFKTKLKLSACRAIDLQDSLRISLDNMRNAGVEIID